MKCSVRPELHSSRPVSLSTLAQHFLLLFSSTAANSIYTTFNPLRVLKILLEKTGIFVIKHLPFLCVCNHGQFLQQCRAQVGTTVSPDGVWPRQVQGRGQQFGGWSTIPFSFFKFDRNEQTFKVPVQWSSINVLSIHPVDQVTPAV